MPMPVDNPLPTHTWEIVTMQDLDAFIEQHLGRPWRLQQQSFLGQDTVHWVEAYKNPEATAKVAAWLASPPAKAPGRLDQPGFGEDIEILTEDLLAELCNRDLLPEGDIRIYVSW